MPDPVPYWLLIAVLQSSLPLASALAMRLYRSALDLHRRDEDVERLHGDLAQGTVRWLRKTHAVGSIVGPAFEAELDTPQGSGVVRFILTRQALELDAESEASETSSTAN